MPEYEKTKYCTNSFKKCRHAIKKPQTHFSTEKFIDQLTRRYRNIFSTNKGMVMAKIPQFDNLHHQLNSAIETELPRDYVGLSQIGDSCHRKLQYYHYWAYKINVRRSIKRLWNFGKMMEDQMIEDLAKCGIIVKADQSELIGETGHWKGHADGDGHDFEQDCLEKPIEIFLVEFKTHNDKSFKDLEKKKVKKSKPGHYDQMIAYMGYKEQKKALYIAYNKNNSEYYTEWVEFDEQRFKELKAKQIEIIAADTLLPRIGNNSPAWYECKMCEASNVCFGRKEPERNCRTCLYVDILNDGKWECAKYGSPYKELSTEFQRKGCDGYTLSTIFMSGR